MFTTPGRNSYSYYNPTSPLLPKLLSLSRSAELEPASSFFLLLMQFPAELATEVEVILTLLIKPVSGEAGAGETRSGLIKIGRASCRERVY